MIRITLKNGSVFETRGYRSQFDDIRQQLVMDCKFIFSGFLAVMASEISTVEYVNEDASGSLILDKNWQVKEGNDAIRLQQ